eukprot:g7764.t1
MFTPDSKRRSTFRFPESVTRFNTSTLLHMSSRDNVRFPPHVFRTNLRDQDLDPYRLSPRIVSPRRRFEQDRVLHNRTFFHFSLKKTVLFITEGDVASSVSIAGGKMGELITIAVHCQNRNRVYYFTVDKETYVQCKFEKSVDDVLAIASFTPFHKIHTPDKPNDRFFLRMDTSGGLAIFQGLARTEDINMALILPTVEGHGLHSITPPLLQGDEISQWHEAFSNVVGNKVDIRLNDNLIGRFEIDLYPNCEVAGDCFAIIKKTNASDYKTLFKTWVREHLSTLSPEEDDWSGFCRSLHAVHKIRFIRPRWTPSHTRDHDAIKQRLTSCFGSYKGESIFILHALHDLYESYKLDVSKWSSLQKLGHLLCSLSVNMGAVVYLDYYCRDFTPEILSHHFGISMKYLQDRVYQNNAGKIRRDQPFDMQSKLQVCLIVADPAGYKRKLTFRRDVGMRFGILRDVFMYINSVGKKLKDSLERKGPEKAVDYFLSCGKELVEHLVSLDWDRSVLETLPFGLVLPIQEFIRPLKEHPPECWTTVAYAFIGREDLISTVNLDSQPEETDPDPIIYTGRTLDELIFGTSDQRRMGSIFPLPLSPVSTPPANQRVLSDGLDDVFKALGGQRFSKDGRLHQVRESLNTTLPQDIGIRVGVSSEEETTARIQSKLQSLVLRTMAAPVGRGAFVLLTVSSSADEIDVGPPLCLKGTVKGQRTPVKLNSLTNHPEEAKIIELWPVFHNAVSTALKIKPGVSFLKHFSETVDGSDITSCTGAGYYYARGLQGRISKECIPEVSRRLGGQYTITQMAAMLGLSISLAGKGDEEASKCMFLHLPQYHPKSYPEADWCSSLIQTAALLSLGNLYRETKNHNMSKRMLDEIGRRPGTPLPESSALAGAVTQDREGFALAAGFAFGLINLGAGNELTGYYHDKMIFILRRYMLGGLDPRLEADREANLNLPPMEGLLGPGGLQFNAALGDNDLIRDIYPLNADLNQGASSSNNDGEQLNPGSHCHVVLEAEHLDTDVTSPAATMALALFFLKTNNKEQARFFHVPETEYELDLVRYDFILLRVLAKALVMWDGILPTEEWIQSMLPRLMTRHQLDSYLDEGSSLRLHSIGQAHIHAIAGACLAIGLKFASTRNEAGRILIRDYLVKFIQLKSKAIDGFVNTRESYGKIDKRMLESIICVLAISLSIIMAGSGHLETYRILESLRNRLMVDPSLTKASSNIGYGDYMAISMAIGFLFLGGGQQGFKTDNASIAALLLSVFPQWPQVSTDNRCHLQAFRHFYVLAAENRTLSAIDVDKRANVYTKIKTTMKIPKRRPRSKSDSQTEQSNGDLMAIDEGEPTNDDFIFIDNELGTPCLLPERHVVESLSVIGPRYYNCTIAGEGLNHLYETLTLHVKKRDSVLAYEDDESGVKMLTTPNTNQAGENECEKYNDIVEFCTKNEVSEAYAGFARTFCSRALLQEESTKDFCLFCRSILSECLTQAKPEALKVYLQIRKLFEKLTKESESNPNLGAELVLLMTNLRIVWAFYKTDAAILFHHQEETELAPAPEDHPMEPEEPVKLDTLNPLIQRNFLHTVQYSLCRLWKSLNFATNDISMVRHLTIMKYFKNYGAWPRESTRIQQLFACFLAAFEVSFFTDMDDSQVDEYCKDLLLSYV